MLTEEVSFFSKRQKETESKHELPSAGSLLNCPQKPGLGQGKARSQELNSGLPHMWQEPNYLSRHQHLPGSTLAVKNQRWATNPGTVTWNVVILTARFNACPRELDWRDTKIIPCTQ